jgi:hypothetical protein
MSKFLKIFAVTAMIALSSVSSVHANWIKEGYDCVGDGKC